MHIPTSTANVRLVATLVVAIAGLIRLANEVDRDQFPVPIRT